MVASLTRAVEANHAADHAGREVADAGLSCLARVLDDHAEPDRDRRHQDRVVVGDARARAANLGRQHAAERADERTDERACVVAVAVSCASCLGVVVD